MDSSRRRPCFIDDEDDVEACFSGNYNNHYHHNHPFFNKSSSMGYSRRNSLRNLSIPGSRSARFYDARFEDVHQQPHFLKACFFCQKSLGDNRDIFMYRGDTPFCSEECRQEQMDIDEAKEKNWNLSSSMKAMRKKEQKKNSSSPSKTQDYSFRTVTGPVAAA